MARPGPITVEGASHNNTTQARGRNTYARASHDDRLDTNDVAYPSPSHHEDNLDADDGSHNNKSRSPSCTPSTGIVTLKRRASSCDSLKESKIHRTSSGRPKAADYDDSAKSLIVMAIARYRSNLAAVSPFPDIAKEAEMVGQVWRDACVRLDITAAITPQMAKLVKFY